MLWHHINKHYILEFYSLRTRKYKHVRNDKNTLFVLVQSPCSLYEESDWLQRQESYRVLFSLYVSGGDSTRHLSGNQTVLEICQVTLTPV